MNRLKSLYVKDFRSIDGEVAVSLDAPIVLIHGPNGAGKTSLLSAIELALTGAVPSMSRAEPDYLAYLPHKDRPFGEVRLEVTQADGSLRSCEIKVTTAGVTGTPILKGLEASFFSERSFLAQSTLGRLLEIYQHSDKKSDSPLTRFVKELLGLDRMEAIIGGLHSAGNIARLKIPVPAYGNVRDEIPRTERALDELKRREEETATRITQGESILRERLAKVDAALVDKIADLPELSRLLASAPEEVALVELVRAKRELEVSRASWTSVSASPGAAERASTQTANQAARASLEDWMGQQATAIETLLARAVALFADVSVSAESSYGERARILGARIAADSERVQRVLAGHETALVRREDLSRQLAEARARVARLDIEIAAAAESNEDATKALSAISAHIHSDVCPVCDRDFSEVSKTPLASHVSAKVAAVVEQAGRLQVLLQGRGHNNAEVSRLEREEVTASADVLSDVELSGLKRRAADLTEIASQLTDKLPQMRDGDRFREEASRVGRLAFAVQSADQSAVVLRNSLKALAGRIGIEGRDDTAIGTLLETVRATIEQREATLATRQGARRSAIESVTALVEAGRELGALKTQQVKTKATLTALRDQKAQADRLIELGKDLVRQTREARGRVVRRVFNDELNAVWRDLFVRLAPEEPFIPAFAIPDVGVADIEAVLETHHRRGGKGGNPRAMLSAGNLNTAALTLFLALHLSMQAKLPMLVIDDPVQSMDEVHIAQFAALLRTLSKQMQRQVIIAVHERSLFDYLALELSPAFEGDRLNIIELGRNAVGKTTSRWDPKLFVADRAIAA